MTTRRIDIIGAGISGLATAYYISRAFHQTPENPGAESEIHVWEKETAPGGLAGTFTTEDFTIEKFYHHIFRRDTALQDLINALGFGRNLVWRPAATGAYYFRQPYRLSTPADLLRFKPLPLIDRFRLGWLALHARTVKDWHKLDDISVKEYIHKVAGENVYRVVWDPLLRGKFGSTAESVSAAWLWSKLVDRGGSRDGQGREVLGYVRGGLGHIFDALVTWLRDAGHHIHLGQAVHRLEGTETDINVIVTDAGTFPTDVVIGCAQLPDLVPLVPHQAANYRKSLQKIDFLANVCLVLTLNRSLSEFYWTNVTETDAPFVGIIEQTNWADERDFNHKHVVYLSAYVPREDSRLTMNVSELTAYYLPAIKHLFPDFDEQQIVSGVIWRAAYAQPIVHVGYRHDIPEIISPIANFFVCTMAQIYPHDRQLSNGVAMARKTAEIVNRYLRVSY